MGKPLWSGAARALRRRLDDLRLWRLVLKAAAKAHPDPQQAPLVFVNISSRVSGFSQNAAFTLLSAIGLQQASVPVMYFTCRAGLDPCVLGTNREDYSQPPPCAGCLALSRRLFLHAPAVGFEWIDDPALDEALKGLSLEALNAFRWGGEALRAAGIAEDMPLGELCLPSLRWALRMHNLPDDEPTRALMRRYLRSAWNVACAFARFLNEMQPQAAVIFNGVMYPEGSARWVALQKGVRAITHEVGFEPFSAFFTDGQATAYPLAIPEDFTLTEEQNKRLDRYLERRFQGDFTMAGIRFWKEIKGLDEAFLAHAAAFKQIVPVFTNVIYDTSQIHANVIFPHMFAWLDALREVIRRHPETLFVIRAHPDEMRPGTHKQARESVRGWVEVNGIRDLPNAVFVDSQESISSYELILRSKFVMVYNSSIGMEATLLGKPVLCGGRARYTQLPTVFFPDSAEAYVRETETFLNAEEIPVPQEYTRNARRFLYYQLYRSALPFGRFMESAPRPGFVRLRRFPLDALKPDAAPAIRAILNGLRERQPFYLMDQISSEPPDKN